MAKFTYSVWLHLADVFNFTLVYYYYYALNNTLDIVATKLSQSPI